METLDVKMKKFSFRKIYSTGFPTIQMKTLILTGSGVFTWNDWNIVAPDLRIEINYCKK